MTSCHDVMVSHSPFSMHFLCKGYGFNSSFQNGCCLLAGGWDVLVKSTQSIIQNILILDTYPYNKCSLPSGLQDLRLPSFSYFFVCFFIFCPSQRWLFLRSHAWQINQHWLPIVYTYAVAYNLSCHHAFKLTMKNHTSC